MILNIGVEEILIGRLYRGPFNENMKSVIYDETSRFLNTETIQRQMRPITKSDEIWIKVNLANARPPKTGCVNHPVTIKAVIDYIVNVLDFNGPIRICETNSFYRGHTFMQELPPYMPVEEQKAILAKVKAKDPSQNVYDFGTELCLELSGIKNLVQNFKASNQNVQILNISKEPVMTSDERAQLVDEVERVLGDERIPLPEVRDEIINHIPRAIINKKLGIVSLAVAKTHGSPQVWATVTIKNIAMGLVPQFNKLFMHKDLAKAIVYNHMIWQIGCNDRLFGIVSGPYGMEEAGPVWGKTVDFPYIIAGAELLKLDCATAMLMFGKPDLIPQIEQFLYAHNKIGKILSKDELKKLQPYSLNFKPHKYNSS